jgi:hypothetical protein
MAATKVPFFKNFRVYMLTCVAYMGSFLFGNFHVPQYHKYIH